MKVSELTFKNIEDENAPDLVCNNCGEEKPGKGQLTANVDIGQGDSYSIIICTEKCLHDFKRVKNIDRILSERINEIRKIRRRNGIKASGWKK